MMKTLKFTPELCEKILNGEKTSTWRLFDDKELQSGDVVEFINKDTGKMIGVAVLTNVKIKTLGSLEEADWVGHETYISVEEMYRTYSGYYGEPIGPESEVKLITFIFTPN